MGGKKRATFKQMEKLRNRERRKKDGGTTKSKSVETKKVAGIFIPNPKSKKVIEELKKMKVLTPYTVASRLDLRLSVAKHFLEELERQGTIKYVSGSKNLRIYKITD